MAHETDSFVYRLWRYDGAPGELIPLLQSAQEHFGYIPRRAIRYISEATHIPESAIYGVITFYSQFRLQPMGKHVVRICAGTACHVSGSKLLIESVQDELGIEVGETTADGLFTLFTVACLGCCSLAPVMMVGEETHGRLTPASVRRILRGYRRKSEAAGARPAAEATTGADR
ncbi:MAG: NADH-quinone oxidoreductase subunit NuoE [Candidatus Eisenbacteria bacterium]|uniref:NADH-quinone oxidoreductase subunit NuoE n=1 Tax=Eiseniibacteriota bacterium TaxID=2212470 RepID=A0A938BQV9_UNCEI|nr:NADH-quinone oxidoreductase subunit NuoE [Candidatus Eisenbacteria bacterium]